MNINNNIIVKYNSKAAILFSKLPFILYFPAACLPYIWSPVFTGLLFYALIIL
jgi:hypothetical protein